MTPTDHLGPLEKVVMDVLWREREATVRTVWQELSKERPIAYTTVMTIMSRLTVKGLLDRKKKGKTYVYVSQASKEETLRSIVQKTIHYLVDRFGDEAVATFVDEADRLSHQMSTTAKKKTKQ
jgi:predicted transcriptional regulator